MSYICILTKVFSFFLLICSNKAALHESVYVSENIIE